MYVHTTSYVRIMKCTGDDTTAPGTGGRGKLGILTHWGIQTHQGDLYCDGNIPIAHLP